MYLLDTCNLPEIYKRWAMMFYMADPVHGIHVLLAWSKPVDSRSIEERQADKFNLFYKGDKPKC